MWNSFKDSKSKAVKMSLKIANVHGSKAETENARLKQKNYALMQENKKLKQDIDDCLDSMNFGLTEDKSWMLIK